MLIAVRCRTCRRMFRCAPRGDRSTVCPECAVLDIAPTASSSDASVEYRGAVRDMVAEFKFRSRRRAARSLAERLVADIRRDPSSPSIDVVTWAPTSRRRAGARGYDQSELLARIVARRLGVPCRRLLERERGLAQTGRSRGDRLQGPVFRARPMKDALDVLVIDDVVTTGATLRAAAHALRLAGAADVHVRALASTPTPFRGSRGV